MDGRRHWRSSSKSNLRLGSEETTSSGPQRAAGGEGPSSAAAPRDGRDGGAHAQLVATLRARLTSYDDLAAAATAGTPQLQTLASDVASQRRQATNDGPGAWNGEAWEEPSPGLAAGALCVPALSPHFKTDLQLCSLFTRRTRPRSTCRLAPCAEETHVLFPTAGRVRSAAPRGGVSVSELRAVRRQLVLGSPAGGASQHGGVDRKPGGVDSDGEEESDAHLAVFDFGRKLHEDEVVHTRLPSQEQRRGATLTAAASMAKASLRGCALPVAEKVPAVASRIYAEKHQRPPRHRQQQETPVSVLSAANRSLWSGHTGGSVRTSASAASAGDLTRTSSSSNGSAQRVTVPHYDRAPSPLARGAEVPPATRTCGFWLGLTSWGAASPAAPERDSRLCSIL